MLRIKRLLYNDFVEINLPFIPRILSKYDFIAEDMKSFFNYSILRKKNSRESINGLIIVPTTFCNGNCIFCANHCLKDKREIMPIGTFKKAVDEFQKISNGLVSLTPTIGESLIDPGFFDKIEYLNKKGIRASFYTNGILLTKKNRERLLDSKINPLFIDVADIDPKYDSEVFQISIETSKKRIQRILKLLEDIEEKNKKINIHLCFRSKRKPRQIIKDMRKTKFWKFYKKGNLKLSFLQCYDNWGGMIKEEDLKGIQTLKGAPRIKNYPCEGLSIISVLPNGDVRLCGCRCLETFQDELIIGNIKKDALRKIITSKKYKEVFENWEKKKFPRVCKNCSFYRPLI